MFSKVNEMKNILVINDIGDCGASYGKPFQDFGKVTTDVRLIDNDPESILAAVFTGGSDVTPSYYGHKNLDSHCRPDRDQQEKELFDKLNNLGIFKFGICRGAQFLCAMAGGTLVQDMRHKSSHPIRELKTDRIIQVNSLHHQMQVPPPNAEVIAVADPKMSPHYVYGEPGFQPKHEYEIVYYPAIKALGVQYHPEIMRGEGWDYYQELIEHYMPKE